MTCDTCKRFFQNVTSCASVMTQGRFSWHECKECWLKAEGKKR